MSTGAQLARSGACEGLRGRSNGRDALLSGRGRYQLPPTQAVLGGLFVQVRLIVPFARRLML